MVKMLSMMYNLHTTIVLHDRLNMTLHVIYLHLNLLQPLHIQNHDSLKALVLMIHNMNLYMRQNRYHHMVNILLHQYNVFDIFHNNYQLSHNNYNYCLLLHSNYNRCDLSSGLYIFHIHYK